MPRALIFDFDGTLADSWAVLMLALPHLAAKYGYPEPDLQEIAELKKMPLKERLKKTGLPFYRIPSIIRDIKKFFMENQHTLQPFPAMREVVLALTEMGIDLHIVTTNSRQVVENFLKVHHMAFFDTIVSSRGLFGKKRSILKLLKDKALLKDEVLYVGDELRDIEACKAAGIRVMSVTWGYDPAALLKKGNPDYLLQRPEDILEIIAAQA